MQVKGKRVGSPWLALQFPSSLSPRFLACFIQGQRRRTIPVTYLQFTINQLLNCKTGPLLSHAAPPHDAPPHTPAYTPIVHPPTHPSIHPLVKFEIDGRERTTGGAIDMFCAEYAKSSSFQSLHGGGGEFHGGTVAQG